MARRSEDDGSRGGSSAITRLYRPRDFNTQRLPREPGTAAGVPSSGRVHIDTQDGRRFFNCQETVVRVRNRVLYSTALDGCKLTIQIASIRPFLISAALAGRHATFFLNAETTISSTVERKRSWTFFLARRERNFTVGEVSRYRFLTRYRRGLDWSEMRTVVKSSREWAACVCEIVNISRSRVMRQRTEAPAETSVCSLKFLVVTGELESFME